jgi:hypothetical protein
MHSAASTGYSIIFEFLHQYRAGSNANFAYGETALQLILCKTLHGVDYREDWTDPALRAEYLWDFLVLSGRTALLRYDDSNNLG